MGMEGAALATIGGQLLSALWQLAFLFGKRTLITLNMSLLKLNFSVSKQIIQTGIPAFLMQISNSVLNIILNASLVKYGGDLALSAIGIVTSIQTLILMPITGLMQGQQPLISYNYGALKMERVKETLKYAIIGATMIALIGFIAVQFFTKSIVYMFNDEADVVKLCSHALHIWFMCLPLIGAQVMCANYFQAIGKIKISSVLNLLRQINEKYDVKHPTLPINRVVNVEFYHKTDDGQKNIVISEEGMIDRSPCGTGTCAKLAYMYNTNKLKLNETFINQRFTGVSFKGRVIEETKIDKYKAIISSITGVAYIDGYSAFLIDEDDPLKYGFVIN